MAAKEYIRPIPIRPLPPLPFPRPLPVPVPPFESLGTLSNEQILKISSRGFRFWTRTYFYSIIDTRGRK